MTKTDIMEDVAVAMERPGFLTREELGYDDYDRRTSSGGLSVTFEIRHLGDWRNGDGDDEEDSDQQVWLDYKKYFDKFAEWVSNHDWAKYVSYSLTTSEKNWCEFTIYPKPQEELDAFGVGQPAVETIDIQHEDVTAKEPAPWVAATPWLRLPKPKQPLAKAKRADITAKIKLTTFWQEYYEFMRRLAPLYFKKRITKSQYDFFKSLEEKLPHHDISKDPNIKFTINLVCRLFVNNAWFRKIFDGYTLDLRKDIVWTMKIAADSKLMRQRMYGAMIKQDPDGFGESDVTVLDKANKIETINKNETIPTDIANFSFAEGFFKGFCDRWGMEDMMDGLGDCAEVSDELVLYMKKYPSIRKEAIMGYAKAPKPYDPEFHAVVKIGEKVIDMTYGQFGKGVPFKIYPYSEFAKNWPIDIKPLSD
jgi:hypothetical protein